MLLVREGETCSECTSATRDLEVLSALEVPEPRQFPRCQSVSMHVALTVKLV
jgi:hypothetical protein